MTRMEKQMIAGDNLRRLRKSAGLTRRDLAACAGVCQEAVSAWESGAFLPASSHYPAIAQALQVSVDDLRALMSGEG